MLRIMPLTTITLLLLSTAVWSTEPAETQAFSDIANQIASQHDEGVARLQEWIRLPSIAAQDVGFPEGAMGSSSYGSYGVRVKGQSKNPEYYSKFYSVPLL